MLEEGSVVTPPSSELEGISEPLFAFCFPLVLDSFPASVANSTRRFWFFSDEVHFYFKEKYLHTDSTKETILTEEGFVFDYATEDALAFNTFA